MDNLACATVDPPELERLDSSRLSRGGYPLVLPLKPEWPGMGEMPARLAVKPRPGMR
jgi:hypothetical protein